MLSPEKYVREVACRLLTTLSGGETALLESFMTYDSCAQTGALFRILHSQVLYLAL